jgi:signal transduction histidine kinase
VVLTIQVDGPVMALEMQKRIFEPFFEMPNQNGHADIGLAAAAAIIKAHGGYIQLQSTPASGSTFKIYLPVTQTIKPSKPSMVCAETV